MKNTTPKKAKGGVRKIDEVEVWGFLDKESLEIMPPSVCPIFYQRWEARLEKRKYEEYYSNTKIVKMKLTYQTKPTRRGKGV